MFHLPHLAGRIFGTPLLIHPAQLATIVEAVYPKLLLGLSVSPASAPRARKSYAVHDGIGIIGITGTLVNRAGGMNSESGLTSYAELGEEFMDAATDPAIRGILLDVHSGGGEAPGMFELADLIYSQRSVKPIVAVANSSAYSAAYALASSAGKVISSLDGGVGSIGAVVAHLDRSEADKMDGLKYTFVQSGAKKVEGNEHQPLSDEYRAKLQAFSDDTYGRFVGLVARNRGISEATVRATEADTYFGQSGVSAGLADGVGSISQAFQEMHAQLDAPRRSISIAAVTTQHQISAASAGKRSSNMEGNIEVQNAEKADTSPVLTASPPVDLEALRNAAKDSGFAAASAILDICTLAGKPQLAAKFIGDRTSPEKVRKELMSAMAETDAATEISGHSRPEVTGVTQEQTPENNPMLKAAKKSSELDKKRLAKHLDAQRANGLYVGAEVI